ncbi:unnamed protein product, partial [marine sediment metagenome]
PILASFFVPLLFIQKARGGGGGAGFRPWA